MLVYAKAIGANTDVVSAQAFVFPKDGNPDELLVLLIVGVGEDGFAAIRKAGLDLEELFFSQTSIGESFEKTSNFLRTELAKLEQFSAVIGFLEKETLYVETINEFTVLLLRQNHTTQLTRGITQEKLISGMLQEGDRVLFLSPLLTEDLKGQKELSLNNPEESQDSSFLSPPLPEVFPGQEEPSRNSPKESEDGSFLSPLLPEDLQGQEPPGNNLPTEVEEEDLRKSLETILLESSLENLEFEVETFLQQLSKPDPIAAVLVEVQTQKTVEVEDDFSIPVISQNPESQIPQKLTLPKFDLITLVRKIPFRPRSKKRLALLVAIIGLTLFIGGNLLINNFKKDSQFNAKLTQAQQKFDQAIGVKDSNPEQSKTLLAEAKSNLKEAQAIKPSGGKELEQKINEGSFLILKVFEYKDLPVFLDLNLIKENFSASRLSMSLGRIAVLDSNTKSLVAINIAQKQPQILAGELQLGDVQFISINGDYVYTYSKDKGISKVDAGNGKTTTEVSPDSEWQRIVDIYGFANNVYLLDEFKNQIWKYIATDNGFSQRNQYLEVGEEADFASARNIQIDGAIWVLKSDNTILKFIQGKKDFFQMEEFDPALDKIKNFYVSDETENIYFLDNDNGRVLVTSKKGEYISQYSGEKFKTADDLVVDEKDKKLYLLEGGKIYQIDLK